MKFIILSSGVVILTVILLIVGIFVVNIRRHREITGKHRLDNRPEIPDNTLGAFPECRKAGDF